MRVKVRPFPAHPAQARILNSDKRFVVAACGRRFGKTSLAGYWAAAHGPGSALGGYPVGWFAPKYKYLLEAYAQIERNLKPVIVSSNKSDKRIDLVGGGSIEFWTLEDKDAGRSRKYRRVVLDESAHAPYLEEAWNEAVMPTLADYQGDAWFISTPKQRGNKSIRYFQELFQRQGKPGFDDWASYQFSTYDNPHISRAELETIRKSTPELVFRQEYLAEFVSLSAGLVKPAHIIYLEGPVPEGLEVFIGVDLAISSRETADYTVIAALAVCRKSGRVFVIEVNRARMRFHEAKEAIIRAAGKWKPAMIAVEQVQYQAAMVQELLRTTGLPVRGVAPKGDKVTRFGPLLTRFEQGMVFLLPDGVGAAAVDELTAFPFATHDDVPDALSLAYQAATGGAGDLGSINSGFA